MQLRLSLLWSKKMRGREHRKIGGGLEDPHI